MDLRRGIDVLFAGADVDRRHPAAHALADPQAPVDRFAFLTGLLKISR